MVVLVRTVLGLPARTLPPTRQLFSCWRSSQLTISRFGRPHFWIPAVSDDVCNLLVHGTNGLQKESWFRSLDRLKNLRSGSGLRFPRGWADVPQTRVKCLSTFAHRKELSIRCLVTLEEDTIIDSNAQAAVEQLKLDGTSALKLAVEELEELENTETVELSLLFCNDAFIQDLNSKWLGKNSPTDVLSFPQDQEPDLSPYLLLGDVIISLETAARQAEERGHTLLDELRILLVHGLLHVLGFDHEVDAKASEEMEEKETEILSKLGWKGKGLIRAAHQGCTEVAEANNSGSDRADMEMEEKETEILSKLGWEGKGLITAAHQGCTEGVEASNGGSERAG